MKKIILLLSIVALIFSCKEDAPKDYAKISGKIENLKIKKLLVRGRSGYNKSIIINDDGTFSDTLHLKDKGELFIFSAGGTSQIFLKNNDDIKINYDSKKLRETLKFSGRGSETSKYLAEKNLLQGAVEINKLFKIKDKEKFTKRANEISKQFTDLMNKYNDIDKDFYNEEKAALDDLPNLLLKQFDKTNNKTNQYVSLEGKPSPDFNNYENYKGGTTSLKDLRGKYVYIDVWATWCGPCKREIPHLKKLEEAFKGKKIAFLSISVDRESAKNNWKKMIKDKKMGGIQLFAKKGDSFAKEYKINSIPRFILLDPKGNVVKANMSRPSNPSTKTFLEEILKK